MPPPYPTISSSLPMKRKTFRTAYNYLRDRTRHMRYAEFRAQGRLIGRTPKTAPIRINDNWIKYA